MDSAALIDRRRGLWTQLDGDSWTWIWTQRGSCVDWLISYFSAGFIFGWNLDSDLDWLIGFTLGGFGLPLDSLLVLIWI